MSPTGEVSEAQSLVSATCWYLERCETFEAEKPYIFTFDVSGSGIETTNHRYSEHNLAMCDVRGVEGNLKLDSHGFAFASHATALSSPDFDSNETVRQKYYPEIDAMMRELFPDAVKIHIFTHLRRRRPNGFLGEAKDQVIAAPIPFAHADFTPHGARVRLSSLLEEETALQCCRFEIINVWRVTDGPNNDWPLAVCGHQTVNPSDIETTDVIHDTYVGESVRAYYNPNHRWYYLSNQQVDEVVIFCNTDSRGMEFPFALHSAFRTSAGNASTRGRESIEVRVACFFSTEG
ncbi:hypothetical protein B0H67DRAFT_675987 [Lasiosphaeris hirsuta]|uniref:Methyltransferase n=1 Tax=Lasiosphaeris hirsuta TaxID=260670 RepID=A0AA39ZSC2_9PEZI|nr:hypothetical protein B0H67DRAFT_675987 [Lasiosphaeris hirsuta]